MFLRKSKWLNVLIGVSLSIQSLGQTIIDSAISLKSAIQLSEQQSHLLRARNYETKAAASNVNVVKYVKMPTVDASYQANLATANNLTGIFYPVGMLPMTGAPSSTND